jgi:hypothetical protein
VAVASQTPKAAQPPVSAVRLSASQAA